MKRKIKELIEKLKVANEFNLVEITSEETREYREAKFDYENSIFFEEDKKTIQRKLEDMLKEIADFLVVTEQWEDPIKKRSEILSQKENEYMLNKILKYKDFIKGVMIYKMERTLIRNEVDWYKKEN